MQGWMEVGRSEPSGEPVWQCEAPLCGALVRVREGDDRRREHDRQFHLLRLESDGGGQDGYALHLDGEVVGEVRLKRETWNLIRYIVSEKWVARVQIDGKTESIGGDDRLRDTMGTVVRSLPGAKAWARGKSPKVWNYPERTP